MLHILFTSTSLSPRAGISLLSVKTSESKPLVPSTLYCFVVFGIDMVIDSDVIELISYEDRKEE